MPRETADRQQLAKRRSLEHRALMAARALAGAVRRRGITEVRGTTWSRFLSAQDALHKFHADRMRRKNANPETR